MSIHLSSLGRDDGLWRRRWSGCGSRRIEGSLQALTPAIPNAALVPMAERETQQQELASSNKDYIVMINEEDAKKIAIDYLDHRPGVKAGGLSVIDKYTIKKDYGWVFICNSRKYIETGDMQFMLIGLGPIVVESRDHSVTILSAGLPIHEELQRYEANRKPD